MLEKYYKVSFENKLSMIKNSNNLKVFKVHIKEKCIALDLMKEELTN